jgi:hypothetical protein
MTKTETDALSALIPTLDESVETAKIKVKNMVDTPLMQINQARSSV